MHTEILRHVSDTPRAVNWEQKVNISDALELLRNPGALAIAARLQFRAVSTEQPRERTDMHDNALLANRPGDARALHRVLRQPSIVAVDVCADVRPRALSNALAHAVALRHLRLAQIGRRFPLSRVLRASGRTLHSLDITTNILTRSHTRAIAAHCVALRRLRLVCDAAWVDLAPLWRAVGGTLRALSLSAEYSYDPDDWSVWRDALQLVREHCNGVRELAFEMFADDTHDAIATLCASYGDQLRSVRFEDCYTSPATYREVAAACSVVRVDTHSTTDLLVPVLDALGERIVALAISGDMHEPLDFDTRLGIAARKCTALERLNVQPNDMPLGDLAGLMRSLLATPKHNLKSLEIKQRHGAPGQPLAQDVCAADDLLKVLADGTGALRQLCFTCDAPPPGAFDELARNNSDLETVKIDLEFGLMSDNIDERWPAEMSLASIVKSFSRCSKLRSLVVDEDVRNIERNRYSKITEACRSLRDRRVYVCVLEEKYLA